MDVIRPNVRIIEGIKYKICTKCEELKLYDSDYYRKGDGKQAVCKKCWNKRRDEQRKKYPEKWKDRLRHKKLRSKFGITLDDYKLMLELQDNKCFICGRNDNKYPLGVDHNHETGEIRKLLCSQCNTGIGMAKENMENCLRFIWYLYINREKINITFESFLLNGYLDTITEEIINDNYIIENEYVPIESVIEKFEDALTNEEKDKLIKYGKK